MAAFFNGRRQFLILLFILLFIFACATYSMSADTAHQRREASDEAPAARPIRLAAHSALVTLCLHSVPLKHPSPCLSVPLCRAVCSQQLLHSVDRAGVVRVRAADGGLHVPHRGHIRVRPELQELGHQDRTAGVEGRRVEDPSSRDDEESGLAVYGCVACAGRLNLCSIKHITPHSHPPLVLTSLQHGAAIEASAESARSCKQAAGSKTCFGVALKLVSITSDVDERVRVNYSPPCCPSVTTAKPQLAPHLQADHLPIHRTSWHSQSMNWAKQRQETDRVLLGGQAKGKLGSMPRVWRLSLSPQQALS